MLGSLLQPSGSPFPCCEVRIQFPHPADNTGLWESDEVMRPLGSRVLDGGLFLPLGIISPLPPTGALSISKLCLFCSEYLGHPGKEAGMIFWGKRPPLGSLPFMDCLPCAGPQSQQGSSHLLCLH